MKKAQIAMTDLLLALILFTILFLGLIFFWTFYQSKFVDNFARDEMELLAFQISDALIRTPGYPSNWESNVNLTQSPGLSSSERVLSSAKIAAFSNFTYNQTKTFFNIERFEYYILIKQNNTVIYETNVTPTGRIVSIRRNVYYENQDTTLDFALWI